jgi:hypothetical protein
VAIFQNSCNFGPDKPKGFPKKLYYCELTIIQDSQPLQGAIVQFFSTDTAQKDWTIGGRTDANGFVIPYTYGKWQGIPEGILKVCVKKEIVEEVRGKEIIFSLVEDKFADPQTTPFEVEIKGKIKQTFDVSPAIKKKVPN